jgi:hypothetical protein
VDCRPDDLAKSINPTDAGSKYHTGLWVSLIFVARSVRQAGVVPTLYSSESRQFHYTIHGAQLWWTGNGSNPLFVNLGYPSHLARETVLGRFGTVGDGGPPLAQQPFERCHVGCVRSHYA